MNKIPENLQIYLASQASFMSFFPNSRHRAARYCATASPSSAYFPCPSKSKMRVSRNCCASRGLESKQTIARLIFQNILAFISVIPLFSQSSKN